MRYLATLAGIWLTASGLVACSAERGGSMYLGVGAPQTPIDSGVAGAAGLGGSGGLAGAAGMGGTGGVMVGPDGTGGVGGTADAGVDAQAPEADAAVDAGTAGPKPLCLEKPSQVALIGDSYINWVSHNFPT